VHASIDAESHALTILQRQLALGQVAGSDVAAQETALAQAQAALPPLEKQLAQQRDLITALAGRLPADGPDVQFDLSSFELPLTLPVSLPADLVRQRPDVRAAESTLHAASAQVGVAIANRLPQFPLNATVGGQSSEIATIFTQGGLFGTLAGGVTQPIFEGGTLLHRQRAAEAGLQQAEAQYRSAAIAACQNVADALHALQSDAEALRTAVAAEHAADRTLTITRRQLELGQVAYLALLNAENSFQQAHVARVQAEAARLADTAALFQALGGGWWNKSPKSGT
jgi:NodT family efflux transporter outer membrane factor (OMF) lipoprotein